MDGTIVVGSVSDTSDVVMFDYKRPIHAVVLDKNYLRLRAFVCGGMGEKVTYSSKNWLDKRVDVVLDEENGPIMGIFPVDDLILWMNDKGILVYHTSSRQIVKVIPKPNPDFPAHLYWPRVTFPDVDRVVVAWGTYIWSLRISLKTSGDSNTGTGSLAKSRYLPSAPSLSFRAVNDKKVEVEHIFAMDCVISGIAGFADDKWLVLAYNEPERDSQGKLRPTNPDLRLCSALDGTTHHEEEIGFNSTDNLGPNDYTLGNHIGATSNRFFVISARAAVIAEHISLDDQLQWFLERKMYQDAWKISQHLVSPLQRLNYGVQHLDFLVKNDRWDEATAWISDLLYLNPDSFAVSDIKSTITATTVVSLAEDRDAYVREVTSQWNYWGSVFLLLNQVERLTKCVPSNPTWGLQKSIFTEILKYWLDKDVETAARILREWLTELYDFKDVTGTIESLLTDTANTSLRRVMIKLYSQANDPARAVPHLIKLRDPNIVQFLADNSILLQFLEQIPDFAKFRFENELDIERLPIPQITERLADITHTLVEKRHEIAPLEVLRVMAKKHLDILSYLYLEELVQVDELLVSGKEIERIQLFAQYDRPKLMAFLTSDEKYDIHQALAICQENAFVDEMVYLLSKIGETKKALQLIMEESEDPTRAIELAKMLDDKQAWDMLLEFAYSRPKFIEALLKGADATTATFYNPITILQNMTTDEDIEGLKELVARVAHDHDLNLLISHLILAIVSKRSEEISKTYFQDRTRGLEINLQNDKIRAIFDKFQAVVVTHGAEGPELRVWDEKPQMKRLPTGLSDRIRKIREIERKLATEQTSSKSLA